MAVLQCVVVLVAVVVFFMLVMQKHSSSLTDEWRRALFEAPAASPRSPQAFGLPAAGCLKTDCPEDHVSFFLQSGAANVVAPKICVQNNLVLGTVLNNAGFGLNVAVINGTTGDVVQTGNFDMYSGDVKPLIQLLKDIAVGSVVLMASYDEPSSKLNDDAKKLISDLGSSAVESLGFRDNWVFVGGKGVSSKSNFEKHLKNDNTKNTYENWPELIQLQGCIPRYLA